MTDENNEKKKIGSSFRDVLRLRDFRLLWIGEAISVLGDQFYLIALPWLALQLTGDPFAVGTVLAVAGVPRAGFMLIGGALSDRFSPRTVMLVSNIIRGLLVGVLTVFIFTELIQMWMLYIFALAFGLADAFFFPASGSIVPQIVDTDHLQSGNALIQGTIQVSVFAGPALAGILIALLDTGQSTTGEVVPNMQGIGIAFAFDTLTFVASAFTLWLMKVRKPKETTTEEQQSVIQSIRSGLAYVMSDVSLRTWFLLAAGLNFFFTGPFFVGVPVLADTRFPEGAFAFGVLMSAFGLGSFTGTFLAGILPKPPQQYMGSILLIIISIQGIGLILMGFISSTILAAIITLVIGASNGYIVILWITWLQMRTPPEYLGRVWSLVMFSVVGLQPVSQALAGAIIGVDATMLFVLSGGCLTALMLLAALNPHVREMSPEVHYMNPTVNDVLRQTDEISIVTATKRTGAVPKIKTGELPPIE
jgi:MFS family permease